MRIQWGSSVRLLALVCILVLGLAVPLNAQLQSSGSITGTVKDSGGSVLPGATVTAVVEATGVTTSTQTNTVGLYSLPNLPVGLVKLTISTPGFKTSSVDHIRMVAGANAGVGHPR